MCRKEAVRVSHGFWTVVSGLVGKGVASAQVYPLWTVFQVITRLLWPVFGRIDRSYSVDGSRLDFLQVNQVAALGSEVKAIVECSK